MSCTCQLYSTSAHVGNEYATDSWVETCDYCLAQEAAGDDREASDVHNDKVAADEIAHANEIEAYWDVAA